MHIMRPTGAVDSPQLTSLSPHWGQILELQHHNTSISIWEPAGLQHLRIANQCCSYVILLNFCVFEDNLDVVGANLLKCESIS